MRTRASNTFGWRTLVFGLWIGLLLLLLYGLGEYLGNRVNRPGLASPEHRKLYWQVTGGVAVACLVNPFHVDALLAPFVLYGTEYPALQAYNLLGLDQPAAIDRLQHYPLTAILYHRGQWGNWSWLNYHVIAGLLVAPLPMPVGWVAAALLLWPIDSIPKSAMRTLQPSPSFTISTFPGFMSRCLIARLCRYASPSAISVAIFIMSGALSWPSSSLPALG